MKKMLLLIIMLINLVLLQAQEVKFISVNNSVDSLQNVNYKSLEKHLQQEELKSDTLATPVKWMVKLQKKLSKHQRSDDNIYIFFCPSFTDSITTFLPLSGKYGYVLFDTTKTNTKELVKYRKKLSTWKPQWDLIHNPENVLFAWAQDEEEGAMYDQNLSTEGIMSIINQVRYDNVSKNKNTDLSTYSMSYGVALNLELSSDLTMDYVELEVKSGKNVGTSVEPWITEELKITSKDFKVENIETPVGQNGDFIKIYYNRLEKASLPATAYAESDNEAVSFCIKKEQRSNFLKYILDLTYSDTIKIFITRTNTGDHSTTGTLHTDDFTVTGYTAELPRGTDNQCKTSCSDNTIPFDCHCIIEGEYNFVLNEIGKYPGASLRLEPTGEIPNGRLGVLVHKGRDDAKGWSQGCILPMPNKPEENSALYSNGRKNTKDESNNFVMKIRNWVSQRENKIREINPDIETIVKKIIIIKTF